MDRGAVIIFIIFPKVLFFFLFSLFSTRSYLLSGGFQISDWWDSSPHCNFEPIQSSYQQICRRHTSGIIVFYVKGGCYGAIFSTIIFSRNSLLSVIIFCLFLFTGGFQCSLKDSDPILVSCYFNQSLLMSIFFSHFLFSIQNYRLRIEKVAQRFLYMDMLLQPLMRLGLMLLAGSSLPSKQRM